MEHNSDFEKKASDNSKLLQQFCLMEMLKQRINEFENKVVFPSHEELRTKVLEKKINEELQTKVENGMLPPGKYEIEFVKKR